MLPETPPSNAPPESAFIGLAPFLRMNIAGADLQAIGQQLLGQVQRFPDDENLWMNLSTALFCLEQRELALNIQAAALAMTRTYRLPAIRQPAGFRLLMLMAPGDLAANTPLDCLLEDSDVDLIYHYVASDGRLPVELPAHDALMVGLSETDTHRELLAALAEQLAAWPQPVINDPRRIPATERNTASRLLAGAPGVSIPATERIARTALVAVADGRLGLGDAAAACDFPVILRPLDSHAGRDLARLADPGELAGYLAAVADDEFFISAFVDYRSADGLFRKFRIALVDGRPLACHMAVSEHWMIHYVNAGMYEDAAKRAEEARFMAQFATFAERHRDALQAIHRRTGLDYLCLDCAETRAGELLIFEIDHVMVVHAMDCPERFPYKQAPIEQLKTAFRDFLGRLAAPAAA